MTNPLDFLTEEEREFLNKLLTQAADNRRLASMSTHAISERIMTLVNQDM